MSHAFSKSERLQLGLRLTFLAPGQLFAYVIRSICISFIRGIPPRLFVVTAMIKVILQHFSARQIQYLSTPTREVYESWLRQFKAKGENNFTTNRLCCDIEHLDDGQSNLLWIGNRQQAKKVILFFHGGGYVSPLLPGHLEWCWRAYVTAGIEMDVEIAVAVLEYTLCPHATYPTQLRQAVSALHHLLKQGFCSRDIVIGGDSAGGNLTAQLLCHLTEPHPTIERIQMSEPLAGAFLVSPWLSEHTQDASFLENSWIDMLSPVTVDKSTIALLGSMIEDKYSASAKLAFPLDRDDICLQGMTAVLSRLYVTVGRHEVFREQTVHFVHLIQSLNPRLDVYFEMQEKQAHDFILLEGQEGRDGECMLAMKTWTKSIFFSNKQHTT